MKVKTLIALSLALVMLLTITTPVFAKPIKLVPQVKTLDQGRGQASLRVNKDNYVIAKVTLMKATPGSEYEVEVQYNSQSGPVYQTLGLLTVGSKGSGKFQYTFSPTDPFPLPYEGAFHLHLKRGGETLFQATGFLLKFR